MVHWCISALESRDCARVGRFDLDRIVECESISNVDVVVYILWYQNREPLAQDKG